MRGALLLSTALAAALSASAEWSDVTMDVYRNWFGEELPHLEAVERDGVKPDIRLELEEPTARNVFGRPQTNLVARLAACIIRGKFIPEEDGRYFLTLPENVTKYRLFLSPDGDARKCKEVELVRHPKLRRDELVPCRGSLRRFETKSVRAVTTRKPLELRGGRPIAFKIHFLPGFYGEGVSLQAIKQN